MGVVLEDAVYRNHKMRDWVLKKYESEREQTVAWETFFAIRAMFPETDAILRGEKIAGGTHQA